MGDGIKLLELELVIWSNVDEGASVLSGVAISGS